VARCGRARYGGAMSHTLQHPDANRSLVDGGPPVEVRLQARHPVTAENPLRVLLVEDSPIVSERLLALINGLGRPIRAMIAATGEAAARLFGDLQPDVAVLDIALPDASGFDLLATFKWREPACVVVMITTYAYPEFRENAALLGADFFFSKASEFERVADVLAALTVASKQA
jgi:DNA-binding NarL/FixJ family response regulator